MVPHFSGNPRIPRQLLDWHTHERSDRFFCSIVNEPSPKTNVAALDLGNDSRNRWLEVSVPKFIVSFRRGILRLFKLVRKGKKLNATQETDEV